MSINFDFEVNGEVLTITAHGQDDSRDHMIEFADSILNLAKDHQVDKILCDERDLIFNLSTTDTFELAEYASRSARMIDKIAVVVSKETLEQGAFYETVASNRGLIIRVTDNYSEAVDWLQYDVEHQVS